MKKEVLPLSFNDVRQSTDKDYSISRKLTPDALQQMQKYLGKPIEVTCVDEQWFYEGEGEGDDHSITETHAKGMLMKVNETTIELQIDSGKITYDSGTVIEVKEKYKKFPFYQDGCAFRRAASTSHISSFTVDGQTIQWDRAGNEKKAEFYENEARAASQGQQPTEIKLTSPFHEIIQGLPEDYGMYRKLTPDMFRQLQGQLGKEVHVSFEEERWVRSGEDDEDHTKSGTRVRGTLTNVHERTIEVDIYYGGTSYDSGQYIDLAGTKKAFPFHQEQFKLRNSAEILHIQTLTLPGSGTSLLPCTVAKQNNSL